MEKRAFKRIPVESSNIKYIGHSYPRRLLEVGFNNGSVYRYKNVNNKIYKELLRSDSKGKAFHTLVRGKYPYKQIVNKDGDKVNKEWNKVAMRDFDEFIKTAGIIGNLTGRTVRDAEAKLGRAINRADKMGNIVNMRRENTSNAVRAKSIAKDNVVRAEKAYGRAKANRDNAIDNIGEAWNNVKDSSNWKDRLKNVAAMPKKMVVDPAKAGIKAQFAKEKYDRAGEVFRTKMNDVSQAVSKENRSNRLLNRINDSVNTAASDLRKAKIKTGVTRGLAGVGLLAGAAYAGKKMADKKRQQTPQSENQDTDNSMQYQDVQYQQPQYQGMM